MRLTQAFTLAALILAAVPASAGTINGFFGPWAPTPANGFDNSTASPVSTFVTTISPDGLTVTSELNNNGDTSHPSFFLQNYSGLLPSGPFSYDYAITLFSPTGFVTEFDDFGHGSFTYASGTVISGHRSGNHPELFPSPYFGYFGVNIDDGAGSASATVELRNFSGPIPEPATLPLLAAGVLAFSCQRRRVAGS